MVGQSSQGQLIGVGLRPTHYPFLESNPRITTNWFEAISENFMNTEGRPLEVLLKMRENYPIGLHGVSLSIGSDQEIQIGYLKSVKKLIDKVDPILVSDHFCWSQVPDGSGTNTHDLLPIPLTREALSRVVDNVEKVQNFLRKQICLENISYYLKFKSDEMTESDFISEVCNRSGCGLLLDVNNIYVNSLNHQFDPLKFVNDLPLDKVMQIHIAGPSQEPGFLFDTHSTPVPDKVWDLLKYVFQKGVNAPIILEWDQDIPHFARLDEEVQKASKIFFGGSDEFTSQ